MKTRISLIVLALILVPVQVSAQFGIKIGYTNSIHKITTEDGDKKVNADGMTAGLSYDLRLPGNLYLRSGIMYGFQWYNDSRSMDIGVNVNEHLMEHNITVPVHLRYDLEVIPEILSFGASLGPSLICGISSKTDVSMFGAIDDTYIQDNYSGPDRKKRIGLGVGGSISARIIRQVEMELGYDFSRKDSFRFTIGYIF